MWVWNHRVGSHRKLWGMLLRVAKRDFQESGEMRESQVLSLLVKVSQFNPKLLNRQPRNPKALNTRPYTLICKDWHIGLNRGELPPCKSA